MSTTRPVWCAAPRLGHILLGVLQAVALRALVKQVLLVLGGAVAGHDLHGLPAPLGLEAVHHVVQGLQGLRQQQDGTVPDKIAVRPLLQDAGQRRLLVVREMEPGPVVHQNQAAGIDSVLSQPGQGTRHACRRGDFLRQRLLGRRALARLRPNPANRLSPAGLAAIPHPSKRAGSGQQQRQQLEEGGDIDAAPAAAVVQLLFQAYASSLQSLHRLRSFYLTSIPDGHVRCMSNLHLSCKFSVNAPKPGSTPARRQNCCTPSSPAAPAGSGRHR